MGNEKFDRELKKMLKNKNVINALIVLLAIVFLWLAYTTFFSSNILKGSSDNSVPRGAKEVSSEEGLLDKQTLDYETKQKEELKEILSKMEGVGDVEVSMYFESGEVKVPAYNSTTQQAETREEDSQGGTRITNQQTGGDTVVMSSNSGENEPFIVQTYKPKLTGILIVAEGASSNKIKYEIQTAISALYNLSLEKVNVYPMSK